MQSDKPRLACAFISSLSFRSILLQRTLRQQFTSQQQVEHQP
jgi:hypothetical protein